MRISTKKTGVAAMATRYQPVFTSHKLYIPNARAVLMLFLLILSAISCKKDLAQPTPEVKTPVSPAPPVIVDNTDYNVLLRGYFVTGEFANFSATTFPIVNVKALRAAFPNKVQIDKVSEQQPSLIYAEDAISYLKQVSAKLSSTTKFIVFKSSITASYSESTAFSSKKIYAGVTIFVSKQRLRVNATPLDLQKYLTDEFKNDIQTQSAEYIVKRYGTHLLVDITIGGKLEALYQSETSNTDRKAAAAAGLSASFKKIFSVDLSGSGSIDASLSNTLQHLHYKTVGGNSSIGLLGDVQLGPIAPPLIKTDAWQSSVTLDNSELIDIGNDGLIPIDQLIPDASKAAAVKAYISQYIINQQVTLQEQPSTVYQFFDSANGKHALGIQNVPSIHGNYQNAGAVFSAYDKAVSGAVAIYEQYNPAKNVWIYTPISTPIDGFSVAGKVFYAYTTQVPGTVPVFEYYFEQKSKKKLYYDYYYSVTNGIPGADWHYTGIAFYTYP